MALSGQALTQAMQPTHFSATNCGISGDRVLKSRMPAVAGRDQAAADAHVGRQLDIGNAAAIGVDDGTC